MEAQEYFEIQATHYAGMAPSVLFLFREPERAANVWRFSHQRHSTRLFVFSDGEGDPIAIQFRNLDVGAVDADADADTLLDLAEVRDRMYRFANFMISFRQLIQGGEIIRDAIPTPDDKVVDSTVNTARWAIKAAV